MCNLPLAYKIFSKRGLWNIFNLSLACLFAIQVGSSLSLSISLSVFQNKMTSSLISLLRTLPEFSHNLHIPLFKCCISRSWQPTFSTLYNVNFCQIFSSCVFLKNMYFSLNFCNFSPPFHSFSDAFAFCEIKNVKLQSNAGNSGASDCLLLHPSDWTNADGPTYWNFGEESRIVHKWNLINRYKLERWFLTKSWIDNL